MRITTTMRKVLDLSLMTMSKRRRRQLADNLFNDAHKKTNVAAKKSDTRRKNNVAAKKSFRPKKTVVAGDAQRSTKTIMMPLSPNARPVDEQILRSIALRRHMETL
jgi:hypothetical protein